MLAEAKQQVEVFKRFPLLSDYPKSFVLKDKREVIIRPMIKEDVEGLYKFFSKLTGKINNF
jgi:hypothetical protein